MPRDTARVHANRRGGSAEKTVELPPTWRKFSLIAKRMLEHVPEVGLYVPVRIYVHQDGQATTRIEYDRVPLIFERFGNEQVNEVARMLDRKLEELATTAAG